VNITLQQVAGILSITEDEVMYLHQQNKLKASVNQDTMKWQFDITEVLTLKEALTQETANNTGD
jgi:hypothetical protein